MTKKTIYIMRGLPGSGKSFEAERIAKKTKAKICSADYFFMKDGKYCFDSQKLHKAHAQCVAKTAKVMSKGKPVVVDNTNVTLESMSVYFALAKQFKYKVKVMLTKYKKAFKRKHIWDVDFLVKNNKHKVPREAIEKMAESFVWRVK